MTSLTPAQTAFLINEYQRLQFFHPMMCARDSDHLMRADWEAGTGEPVWTCPDCGWVQRPSRPFAEGLALATLRLAREPEARNYYALFKLNMTDEWAAATQAELDRLAT
jgi:hypothetical protein